MLKRSVTFVVGAGASCEFGLPDGRKLAREIASLLDIKYDFGTQLISGDGQIAETLRRRAQNSNSWQQACWRVRDGLPNLAYSIDNYMDNHSDDDDVQLVGRVAIAKSILRAEGKSLLRTRDDGRGELDFGATDETWLGYLFRMLQEGCSRRNIENFFSQCRFVVFNYDRCIEQFFEHALVRHYSAPRADVQSLLQNAPIVHVYGSIGPLVGQTDDSAAAVAFGRESVNLLDVAGRLRTYTQQIEEQSVLDTISDYLEDAKIIVFLGFAFHPLNTALLRRTDETNLPRVIGTAFERSDFDCEAISQELNDLLRRRSASKPRPVVDNKRKCFELMRDYSSAFVR